MHDIFKGFNNSASFLNILKNALIDIVPIFFIGFTSSLIISVPVPVYQSFINTWNSGIIYNIFRNIYGITFGLQAVFALLFYSHHIFLSKEIRQDDQLALVGITVCTFCLFTNISQYPGGSLGPRGLIIAYISIILAYLVYRYIGVKTKFIFSDAWDSSSQLSSNMQVLIPIFVSVLFITLFNEAVIRISGYNSVNDLVFTSGFNLIYGIESGFLKALVVIFLSNTLWFFGIHGSVALEDMLYTIFYDASLIPTEVFTHSFYTAFIIMGGCGVSLCLVLSLIIYGKRIGFKFKKSHRIAFFLSIFNVNDFLVFGLPIIFNKAFLIPFLTVPIVLFIISYWATILGIIPYATNPNSIWMAPVFISGYMATGSISGALLQLLNIALGTVLYMPFVKKYVDRQTSISVSKYNNLVDILKKCEALGVDVTVTSTYEPYADVVKEISNEILSAMKCDELPLYYQPQFDSSGKCIGAEALLRFKHGIHGVIYPPLVFKIAKEHGYSVELDKAIIIQAFKDIMTFRDNGAMDSCKTSINVTGASVQSDDFELFLSKLSKQFDIRSMKVCLEITEQDALTLDEYQRRRFKRIHEMGFSLAIDDFSMGNTSAHYLTGDSFDILKLDGYLVSEIVTNKRTHDVISSIIELSNKLNLDVIAEFVSSNEIRDELLSVGCTKYQGYIYSPAVTKDEYIAICMKASIEDELLSYGLSENVGHEYKDYEGGN